MRVIFMGTPEFSVPTLKALAEEGHDIVLAVTQPDRPRGRGKAVQFPPVKAAALDLGIEVFQPRRVREEECVERLQSCGADIIVVAAFGQILPARILEMPKYGCVNVHASLLPRYRGASPIQWAVINGDHISGVTTMRMDEGLDTGDIIFQEEVILSRKETSGSLSERMSRVGASLCARTLEAIAEGTAPYFPQNHASATMTKTISKQFGEIDWYRPAARLECLVRGLNPWPSAYTELAGRTFKIWDADTEPQENGEALPGTVVRVDRDALAVQTGDGLLVLREVQIEGKRRMSCGDFLRGFQIKAGIRLG